jgi:DNA-binding PadR family transcriptional regulator
VIVLRHCVLGRCVLLQACRRMSPRTSGRVSCVPAIQSLYSGPMFTSYPLLGILERRPNYGYDIKHEYDRLFAHGKPLAFGQVYGSLARLQRDDKIVSTASEQGGGPERKRYAITPAGSAELNLWLGQPENLQPDGQVVLFTKVVTAILVNKSPNRYLDAQRKAHIQRMRELTKLRRDGDLSQTLRADYSLFHLEADLRWIDVTVARLEDLKEQINHGQ